MSVTAKPRSRSEPLVVVETADLPRDDWLNYRRLGIGGSDVAAILGVSPFRTARDIYYDKLGVVAIDPDESNWVSLEMGHLLEDLVARIFAKKTGYRVFQIKKMFRHPKYPFMLADVDYFVELPDGSLAILEIKTTNYNAKENWFLGEYEITPEYYELQGRHYMAVMDIDRVFFCCLYGNTEDEVIIREVKRDKAYEAEMIYLEQEFWMEHVQKQVPPPYVEDGDLVMESVRMYGEPADENAPTLALDISVTSVLMQYMEEIQILSPFRRRGDASADNINQELRDIVNPFRSMEEEVRIGSTVYRVGDRVMQTKNTKQASNGDLGYIRSIDLTKGIAVEVDFGEGRKFQYNAEALGHLELAYATTVHKAQGGEYDTVLMPILKAHSNVLD